MAKNGNINDEELKGLKGLAKTMAQFRNGITNMPNGPQDKTAENQVTEMDMIAGICSAALFGSANRNKSNYQTLLGNPNKNSYLGQILTILTELTGYVEPDDNNEKRKKNNLLDTITSCKPIPVKLMDIAKDAFENIDRENSLAKIIIDINGINNIDDLNKVLVELAENTNNVGLLDGLTGLFDTISEINKLTSIDISKVIDNINNINELAKELKTTNIELIDTDKINQLIATVNDIQTIINDINSIQFSDNNLDINNIDINFGNLIDKLSNLEIKNTNIKNNIKNLNDILVNNKSGLISIFNNIKSITPKELNSNIDGISKILDSIINLLSFSTKGQEIDLKIFGKIKKLTKKSGDLEQIFDNINKLTIDEKNIKLLKDFATSFKVFSQIDLKQFDDFSKSIDKFVKNIIILGKSDTDINLGFTVLKNGLNSLKDILDEYSLLDLSSIKYLADLMGEINKFILVSTLTFIVLSYTSKILSFETIGKFVSLTAGLLAGISLFILISSYAKNDISKLTSLVRELEIFTITIGGIFILISLVSKYITWEDLGIYGSLVVGLLFIYGTFMSIIDKFDNLNKISKVLLNLSIFIATTSTILLLVSKTVKKIDLGEIGKFALLIGELIIVVLGAIKLITKFMSPIDANIKISKEFCLLILSLGASLALGSWVAQNVQINTIISFGLLLSLMIAAITLPLLALQIKGELLLQGAADLGKLILYATAGMLLGAIAMSNEELKAGVKDFIWIYLGFIGGIIAAVGLAAWLSNGNALESIQGLHKIIIWSTACLLLGAYIFEEKDLLWSAVKFGALLAGFIAIVSLAIGGAVRMMKDIKDAKWILLELMGIITITSGIMLFAAYLMKDNKDMETKLLTFTICSLVLIGGIAAILYLFTKNINEAKLSFGLFALGMISLAIGVIGLAINRVMEYASGNYLGVITTFTICSLVLIGGISLIIALIEGINKSILFKGLLAISLVSLMILGLGYTFKIIYNVLENSVSTDVIWDFVFQSIVLVGGISLIVALIGIVGISQILKGLLAVGLVTLIIWGLVEIFGLMYNKLLKYDNVVSKMWAVSMSMLGIIAVYLIAMAGIGFLMLSGGAILCGAGLVAIALTGLIIWGMTEVLDNLLEADSRLGLSSDSSTIWKATDGLFNLIQHIMNRVKDLDTGMFELPDWIKNTSFIGSLAGGINNVIGAVFSIPSLISVGFAMITLYLSTIAIKSVFDLMANSNLEDFCKEGGPVDNLFNIIDHIVYRMTNLGKHKDKFTNKKSEDKGFFSKLTSFAGGILDIIGNVLNAGSNMFILGMALLTLYITSNTLEKLNTIFIDENSLKSVKSKVDKLFEIIEYSIGKISNSDIELKTIGKSKNIISLFSNINDIIDKLTPVFNKLDNIIKLGIWSKPIIDHLINPLYTYLHIVKLFDNIHVNRNKYRELNNLNDFCDDWIKIINKISKDTDQKTNALKNSIETIFNEIAAQQTESKFDKHTETLEKYVTAINSADINKIESMTTLAYAVTDLGDKIGNIDKFADTLSNKVSNTLIKLSNEIKSASTIIKSADKLHSQRQLQIKESIKEITNLMDKSMVVEIKNESENNDNTLSPTPTLNSPSNNNLEIPSNNSNVELNSSQPSDTYQTSNNDSNSRITIDIDYNLLAEAIAKAFKKING